MVRSQPWGAPGHRTGECRLAGTGSSSAWLSNPAPFCHILLPRAAKEEGGVLLCGMRGQAKREGAGPSSCRALVAVGSLCPTCIRLC